MPNKTYLGQKLSSSKVTARTHKLTYAVSTALSGPLKRSIITFRVYNKIELLYEEYFATA